MTWLLIVTLGGFTGVSDMKQTFVTEMQCKAAVRKLYPLRRAAQALCVGPLGETFTFDDVASE